MKWQAKSYSFPLQVRYHLSDPLKADSNGLAILLHGYQDSAKAMIKRLGWLNKKPPFRWLAINGPFPVPVWSADGFKEAYAWYFRDSSRDLTLVTPTTTAESLKGLLGDLGLNEIPKVFFGFSQGGYLAPYLAKHAQNVRAIVGLGCGYTEEGYANLPPLKVLGFHGTQDEVVSWTESREEHARLMQRGFSGYFHEVPNLTHTMNETTAARIAETIEECLR